MTRQNESTLSELRTKPSWRKDGTAAPVQGAAIPSAKRRAGAPEKGPTFLKVYVIPVLLFNLAIFGWTFVATHAVQGVLVYLGYALIVTVGLRVFLTYLDSYGSCS